MPAWMALVPNFMGMFLKGWTLCIICSSWGTVAKIEIF
jgi:hypothetical protein